MIYDRKSTFVGPSSHSHSHSPAAAAGCGCGCGCGFGCGCGCGRVGDLAPLGLRVKKQISNGLVHNRSKVSGSWAEIEGIHANLPRSIFSLCQKIMRVAESGNLEWGSCSQIWDFSKPSFFCGNLRRGGGRHSPNRNFCKIRYFVHSK